MKVFPNNIDLKIVTFYGITREPTTRNYALVFKLEDSGLRHYLLQRYHHNLQVFAKPEIHYKTHKLMKGIWKDNFISPIKRERKQIKPSN